MKQTDRVGYDAYREAWNTRRATADDSADVLTTEWARAGYSPDADEREWWLRAWTAAVPPRGLTGFLAKDVGHSAVSFAKEIRDILTDPELPDWLLPPPQFKMLSVGLVAGDVEKRRVPFTPVPVPFETLERIRLLPTSKKDGHRKVRAWLHPGSDAARVPVMVGGSQVGWTNLDESQLRRLRPRRWAKRTKVADGNLRILIDPSGQVVSGRLKVHLPPATSSD